LSREKVTATPAARIFVQGEKDPLAEGEAADPQKESPTPLEMHVWRTKKTSGRALGGGVSWPRKRTPPALRKRREHSRPWREGGGGRSVRGGKNPITPEKGKKERQHGGKGGQGISLRMGGIPTKKGREQTTTRMIIKKRGGGIHPRRKTKGKAFLFSAQAAPFSSPRKALLLKPKRKGSLPAKRRCAGKKEFHEAFAERNVKGKKKKKTLLFMNKSSRPKYLQERGACCIPRGD